MSRPAANSVPRQVRTTPAGYAGRPSHSVPSQLTGGRSTAPRAHDLPGASRTGGRVKQSAQYIVTLRLEDEVSFSFDSVEASHLREDIVQSVLEVADVVAFACALERGLQGSSSYSHVHCYFEFTCKYHYEYIRDCLASVFDCGIDVQFCKSKRNWLKYISKEDFWLYSNIKHSNFSGQFQLYQRALNNEYSYVREFDHRGCYKYVQQFYSEVRSKQREIRYCLISPFDLSMYGSWAYAPFDYYCNHVSTEWYHKKKHLYLWGPADTGKTMFVENLIRDARDVTLFVQGYNFHELTSDHQIIFVNDFKYETQHRDFLLNLLEGKTVYIKKLFHDPRPVEFKGLVIFTSNYEVDDSALFCRLSVFASEYGVLPTRSLPKTRSILCSEYTQASASGTSPTD